MSPAGQDSGDCIAVPCLTLAYTVELALSGDKISVSSAMYSGSGNVNISVGTDLLIVGPATFDCGFDSFFLSTREFTVTLQDLDLRNGFLPGGKGGLLQIPGGTLLATNVSFSSSVAAAGGSFSATECQFINNSAKVGGAGLIDESDGLLEGCKFTGNTASNSGGGVYLDSAVVSLKDCLFEGNRAVQSGGTLGLYQSDLNASNTFVANSSTQGNGGGLWATGPYNSILISGGALTGNTAGVNGAGAYLEGGWLNLQETSLVNNQAGQWGGGLALRFSAKCKAQGGRFSGNTATAQGGAAYLSDRSNILLYGTVLSGNVGGTGDDLFCSASSVTLDSVQTPGGEDPIYCSLSPPMTYCTVTAPGRDLSNSCGEQSFSTTAPDFNFLRQPLAIAALVVSSVAALLCTVLIIVAIRSQCRKSQATKHKLLFGFGEESEDVRPLLDD